MYSPDYLVIHHSVTGVSAQDFSNLREECKYHILLWDQLETGGGVALAVSVPNDRPSTFAVGYFNSRSLSVCCLGNYNTRRPSPLLIDKLVQVCVAKCRAFGIPASHIVSHGQAGRELVAPHLRYSTECCGRLLEQYLPDIRKAVQKYLDADRRRRPSIGSGF
jgi:hypothetical protein